MAPARTKVIVAIGDSITDGSQSTPDTNGSWPDLLSKRLPALPDGGAGVDDRPMGIGSNRLVSADTAFGPSAVYRFDTDKVAGDSMSPTMIIIFEGVNDLGVRIRCDSRNSDDRGHELQMDRWQGASPGYIKVFGETILAH